VCGCPAGFWGAKCENYDNPCQNSPCQNGGACMIANQDGIPLTDRAWGHFCACKYPFYGLNCESRWNPSASTDEICAGNKCENGGTCYKRSYGAEGGFHDTNIWDVENTEVEPYACNCPNGFAGLYCETALDKCDMQNYINPCANGGFCSALDQPFTSSQGLRGVVCTCKCGFYGRRCEFSGGIDSTNRGVTPNLLDFCNSGMCQNGAECVNTLNRQGAACLCTAGWTGTYCDVKQRSAAAGVAPSIAVAALVAVVAAALKF